jgi:formylglycine-generating enzyme required for sulfatase activity
MKRPVLILVAAAALIAGGGAIFLVVKLAGRQRRQPERCPPGLVALGPRCCGVGQRMHDGRCTGQPTQCAADMTQSTLADHPGCVATDRRIDYSGGTLHIGASDWEAPGDSRPRTVHVEPFELDAAEVTVHEWQTCVAAGTCRAVDMREPGRPVTNVSPTEAQRFCHFVGGQLPTGDQWLFAAEGPEGRRYPWGATGLVCRRVAFGLVEGPCAKGATGPELAGARPDGASPEGALDLAGNVAEWTAEPDGRFVARGGSYRSRVAADLKSWSVESGSRPEPYIGFRCAYAAGH